MVNPGASRRVLVWIHKFSTLHVACILILLLLIVVRTLLAPCIVYYCFYIVYGSMKILSYYLTAYYSDGIFPIECKYPIGRSFNQYHCKKINMSQDMFSFRFHSGLWIQLHFRASISKLTTLCTISLVPSLTFE